MKWIRNFLVSVCCLFMFSAHAAKNETCLAISDVKSATFVNAKMTLFSLWVVSSSPLNDDWGVHVLLDGQEAQTKKQAIEKANKLLQTTQLLAPTILELTEGKIVCAYTENYSPVSIVATNPPQAPFLQKGVA